MPPTDVESLPDSPPRRSLEYDRTSTHITRRQFRFLLFLTLLNTILLGTFIVGPAASQFVRAQWKDYQVRRQLRQAQQKQDAFLQQAGSYALPPDQVVYEENPQEALKLLNDSSQSFIVIERSPFQNGFDRRQFTEPSWQVPALRKDDPIVTRIRSLLPNGTAGRYATVLLHNLKNPRGEQRLVWVTVSGRQDLVFDSSLTADRVEYDSTIATQRVLTTMIIETKDTGQPLPSIDTTSYRGHLLPQTPGRNTIVHWKKTTDTWANAEVTVTPKAFFRFYAAQVDPKDSYHFTIDYSIDGQRDTLDGYLKDNDTVLFSPRSGRITSEGPNGQLWNPFAAPATRPSPRND